MILKSRKTKGFTLIELLIVFGILVVLIGIAVSDYRYSQRASNLSNTTEEIINTLRLAQNKTIASEGPSEWGVFFDDSASPHQFVLFKGGNYGSRDISFDEIQKFPSLIEFSQINLEGGKEINFHLLSGESYQAGNISLKLSNGSETRTIYIEKSGRVELALPSSPSDSNRIKDSRHIHFDYSRIIDTVNEELTLTFEGGVAKKILISENLQGGQIYWEGEVEVAGATQKIKITSHTLNNPISYTQFSIHRDRRYNNKTLNITINGDSSGTLVQYSADGLITNSTSIFASNLQWQ